MNNLLFLDTETTGFKKTGLIVEGQARVCQAAMIMTDERGKVLAQFSCLVQPDGWTISNGAKEHHGISQEDCERYGLAQAYFMGMYLALVAQCKLIVAHNKGFDEAMMEAETAYWKQAMKSGDPVHKLPWFCTQKETTHICKIPPTPKMLAKGRTHYKTPSLAEAYFHFTGKRIKNAHDAMADAKACMEIYFAMRGIKL